MKKVMIFMMLLVMTTALCACNGGTDEQNEGPDSVYYGGKITVGITQDLDSLDPHKAVAAGTKEVLYNIFEGLIKVSKDGEFVPAVASSYEISPDGMKYTFRLRQGVKFHNGKDVTADDVIYSLKRVAGMLENPDPEVPKLAAFSIISAINKTEDGIEVVLSEPNTELIGYFTSSIIPNDYDKQSTFPVGTGPFRFVSYEPLTKLELEKNEDYYNKEAAAFLDGVTFKICASTESAFLELQAGSMDLFPYLTEDQAKQLEGRYTIESGTMNLVQALFLNNAVEPFNSLKVRQAINYAIDKQEILNVVAGGKGAVIGTNMFPSFSKYYEAETEHAYDYDPEKAKALLTEAGYPDGISFTIAIPSNYDFHVRTGEVIVSQLAKAGIKAEIKLVEWASWLSDIYQGRQFEATVVGLDSQLAPSDIMRFYPTDSKKNFINYNSAEFDRIFALAKQATNEETKAGYYKQLETILTSDAASAYIQSPAQLVAVSPKIGGYTFYPVFVQDMSTIYYKHKP